MKTINRNQVKGLFPQHIYERGFDYYMKNRVSGLSYNRNTNTWFAEVDGTRMYYVEIDLSKLENGVIVPFCECPAFETYHSCKHIVATLLEVTDQKEDGVLDQQATMDFMNGLLEEATTETNVLTDRLPMHVEYILKIDNEAKLWLEMKTGVSHRYVVRNIRDFLTDIASNYTYFFTKKFSFDPDEHYFLEQDEAIFDMCQTFIETGDLYSDNGMYQMTHYDRRSLLIPTFALKSLLEKLQHRDVSIETPRHHYNGFELEEDTSPYMFTVTYDQNNHLMMEIDDVEETLFLETYRTVFADGVFHFPAREQMNIIQQLQKIGTKNQAMPISETQKDQFFSETLPILKRNAELQIAETVRDEIVEYPLRATLYLQYKEDMIVGDLTYYYGDYSIHPFREETNKNDVIIVRDSEKEKQIMNLIEQSNFHYNGKELYINMTNDEEVYEFLYTILPILDEYVELYLTSQIQQFIVETEPVPSTTVHVEQESNLLEIGFDISGINDDEVDAVLQAVIEKQRFYKLDSGAIMSLEGDSFHKMGEMFQDLQIEGSDMKNGAVQVPVYRGLEIDEMIDTKKYDDSFRKLLHTLQHPEEQIFELPDDLQADLRAYQEVGFQWFKSLSQYQLGGILADDMGLGKTVQTIAYLLSESSKYPHLIVVPSSVIYNWRNEFAKFAPNLETVVISGTPLERAEIIEESHDKQIWITSYGTMRQDVPLYEGIQFQTLILDEAQFIKNYQTKTSKAIRALKATRCFALSGTPIENSVDELWAIFQVVLPGLMPSQREFRKMKPEKIASLTRPFILRRLKEEVLQELPDKIETVHHSELTKEQKDLYVGYLQELQQVTSDSIAQNHFQQNRMKILAGLTRLRQLCCHPSLFIENYEGRSGKLDELMQQVETMMESGKRMLIFSQFTSMHELIKQELEKRDIDYFYLQGQTSSKDRVEMSEAFNEGEKNVFLISLRAGGTGLNLTGADTVLLFDLWWNPAVEDQAAGRAHRFGQKNVVQVIRFITEGTIEEKIYDLQQKKRELIDQVVQPGETMLSSLTEADVKELLSL